MKENLLQYIWNFKLFERFDFCDTKINEIEILDFGRWNKDSGPDFLNCKVKINNLILAGHIELHVKASDWIFHSHRGNREFGNIILHAVYIDDVAIEELDINNISTLVLKNYISPDLLRRYDVFEESRGFIPCEKMLDKNKIPFGFHEENLLKKLNEKASAVDLALARNHNNYEEVLFQNFAYTFGLKINAEIFRLLAENIDYSVLNKIRQNAVQTEALLFGLCGWLEESQDGQMKIWQREFNFLKAKYSLTNFRITPKFSKLRPPNFPTIRLSQLASLYSLHQNLFSKVTAAKNTEELYKIFEKVKASYYWDNHFVFGKTTEKNYSKTLTKDFVHLIIINTALPLKYAYHRYYDENTADEISEFYRRIPPEKNTIITEFQKIGIKPKDALESQSLVYHFKNFCSEKKCLNCTVGFQLLKK